MVVEVVATVVGGDAVVDVVVEVVVACGSEVVDSTVSEALSTPGVVLVLPDPHAATKSAHTTAAAQRRRQRSMSLVRRCLCVLREVGVERS